MRLAVLAFALVGCIEPSLVVCDDGTACPIGYTCTANGCRSPAQIEACEGHAEGELCATSAGQGTCRASACEVSSCGNGRVEGADVCDDGNLTAGDGCNGTCSSTEVCGNGIVEL